MTLGKSLTYWPCWRSEHSASVCIVYKCLKKQSHYPPGINYSLESQCGKRMKIMVRGEVLPLSLPQTSETKLEAQVSQVPNTPSVVQTPQHQLRVSSVTLCQRFMIAKNFLWRPRVASTVWTLATWDPQYWGCGCSGYMSLRVPSLALLEVRDGDAFTSTSQSCSWSSLMMSQPEPSKLCCRCSSPAPLPSAAAQWPSGARRTALWSPPRPGALQVEPQVVHITRALMDVVIVLPLFLSGHVGEMTNVLSSALALRVDLTVQKRRTRAHTS